MVAPRKSDHVGGGYDIWICGYDMWISGYVDIWICGYVDVTKAVTTRVLVSCTCEQF